MAIQRGFGLRVLIPWILCSGCVADLGLRLAVPRERMAFRAWEAVLLPPGRGESFRAGVRYFNAHAYGDLANFANLPAIRRHHAERFTTDALGFRQTPPAADPAIRTVILGDSFVGGAGLSDEETLTARLAALSGVGAYNAGGIAGADCWARTAAIVARLGMRRGTVIYEHSGRLGVPEALTDAPLAGTTERIERRLTGWVAYSPLEIAIARQFRQVENDRWLPNPGDREVVLRRLRNGQLLAFLAAEVRDFETPCAVSTQFFTELAARVRATGNELLVVLAPHKYTVYYPLLAGVASDDTRSDSNLAELAGKLREVRVRVVDLTPVLRAQAAALLAKGEYNYRLDDTHWNEAGVSRAAEAILEAEKREE